MIKLEQLHKYYNKGKRNEIHVINDANLSFNGTGLVVLLGASGSGKTTLLNVIGGLDKVHKGSITFDNETVKRYKTSVWDKLRNRDIGYIFQNYYLLPELSVYENVALTLRMIGIEDSAEIDKRLDYLLEAVNMKNYKKRKANQLSGGQQQRIAIVRALAKNPKVLIADEPTGNLDSKNTLDIMNTIKQISKERLVIMVTHERELANHFADRIIEIEDGKVKSDYENKASSSVLDTTKDNDIYLKDFDVLDEISSDKLRVSFFSDNPSANQEIKLILKNDVLYIDVSPGVQKKTSLITKDSEVKVYDGHRHVARETIQEVKPFHLGNLKNPEVSKKHKSVIKAKYAIKMAFDKLAQASRGAKMLYVGFGLAAAVVALTVSMLGSAFIVDIDSRLMYPKETLSVTRANFTNYNSFVSTLDSLSVNGYSMHDTQSLTLYGPIYYQMNVPITGQFHAISPSMAGDLSLGRMPENRFEMAITEGLANQLLDSYDHGSRLTFFGITKPRDFVGLEVESPYRIEGEQEYLKITITGLVKSKTPLLVYSDEAMLSLSPYYAALSAFESNITLVAGELPTNERDVLVPHTQDLNLTLPMALTDPRTGRVLTVVGTYEYHVEGQKIEMTKLILQDAFYHESVFLTASAFDSIFLYASNVKNLRQELLDLSMNATYHYADVEYEVKTSTLESAAGFLTFATFAIIGSAIGIYFVIRSSMINRIYEIGVYRSLGVPKKDIIKTFMIEIVFLTSLSSLIGFGAMTYFLNYFKNALGPMATGIHVSVLSITAGLLFIYTVNLLSGLFPVTMLLRNTPAEINTKYDL